MERIKSRIQYKIKSGIISFLILLIIAACASFLHILPEMEHYSRVYKKPLLVTATIIRHDSISTHGKTRYNSYIEYIADGWRFTNIEYESKKQEGELTPVGNKVALSVSPENPSVMLSDLEHGCKYVHLSLWIFFFSVSCLNSYICHLLLSASSPPLATGKEQEKRNVLLKIRSRIMRPVFLLAAIAYTIFPLRYPMLLGSPFFLFAAACIALWAWGVVRAARDLENVQ